MSLEQKINESLKEAMKAKDKVKLDALRSIRSTIIEFNKSGAGREMNEEDEIKALKSAAKRRKDAIEMYEKGGRQELADKEKAELEVIESFLPEQMSDEVIGKVVEEIIAEVGAESMSDMGKVMGPSMKRLGGQADGAKVKDIVKQKLGG